MITQIVIGVVVSVLGWAYLATKPPPPKICGSPGGPPVTSPRVKLNDGRYLAYKESGVRKEEAKHKIIFVHGFDDSKDMNLPLSQEFMEEFQLYLLTFDRAGYGESDPNPNRSVKSEAFDIEELAEKMQIGQKFYLVGISMGAYPVWSCLKYIPHKLLGASLVVPFVHYWWPNIPPKVSNEAFKLLLVQDQWSFRVAHYAPWLFYWWMNQKLFPSLSILQGNMAIFSTQDLEIIKRLSQTPSNAQKVRQQGEYESLYRDILVSYANWEFDPTEISNPFPDEKGSVHIWQGYEDRIIPRQLNRYISQKLPWIRYHEISDGGHLLIFNASVCQAIFKSLLTT